MKLKVFVQDNCNKCPAAKELVQDLPKVEYWDIGQADGLAEAAFYNVFCTPSLLVVDDAGMEMQAWRCDVPSRKDLREIYT